MSVGVLAGRRVLELADESGSYCGKLLADLGAEVVKIEAPGGDPGRFAEPRWQGARSGAADSFGFLYRNAGKRSLVLDLKVAEERERFVELCRDADLVVESFAPGTLDALGLDLDTLLEANPKLVVTSITGFGQCGPHRDFKSCDLIANAMGGVAYVTGAADDPPVTLRGAHAHVMASTCAAASSILAMLHAGASGRGQRVDISIQEVVCAVAHVTGIGKWREDGIVPRRMGSGLFASIPSGSYRCRDGSIYLMVNRPAHWRALAGWIHETTGESAILDPIFEGPSANRLEHRVLIDHFVGELTSRHTVAEMYHEGQRRHLAFTPVNSVTDVVVDPHLRDRGFFVDVDQDDTDVQYPMEPYRFATTPFRVSEPVVPLGMHQTSLWGVERPESPPPSTAEPDAPALDGIRVVEFTAGMAGPWIGRFMAYHGADVIKVESNERPDVTRQYIAPEMRQAGAQTQLSPWLTDWNAGKRCVALDLTKHEGVELALRLVAQADVVIENYATGVMDKLGLSDEKLRQANPDAILFSTTGFGDSGPCKDYVTWGPNIEAVSGLSRLTGFPGRDCTMTQYAYPDSLSALHGLVAVLACLDRRRRTGEGETVNLSQLEASIAVVGELVMETLATGRAPAKLGNGSLQAAPHGCYRCLGEDRWCAIAVFDDTEWRSLCEVMGRPDLAADSSLVTLSGRQAAAETLTIEIEKWTAALDPYEVMQRLQAAGVAAGVVQTAADKFEHDEHLRERGFFETIAHEVKGDVIADGIPTGLTVNPGETMFAGRAIGADNRNVLIGVVGLSEEEYTRYVALGAVEEEDWL